MIGRYWFKFNYDRRGFGDLEFYDKYSKVDQLSFKARTGSNQFRNGAIALVNAIEPRTWFLPSGPETTPESGMFVKGELGYGWKWRLWKKENPSDTERLVKYRSRLLIHPDGNLPGSLGCIVTIKTNAMDLYHFAKRLHSNYPGTVIPVLVNQAEPYHEAPSNKPKSKGKPMVGLMGKFKIGKAIVNSLYKVALPAGAVTAAATSSASGDVDIPTTAIITVLTWAVRFLIDFIKHR